MIKRKKKWLGVFAALVMILSVCGFQETVLASERLTEKRVVVLDPGHGGNDAGACAWYNGYLYQEAAINWKIAWYTMQELKKIDEVAYVRFASVYRQFADVESFFNELKKLMGDRKEPQK